MKTNWIVIVCVLLFIVSVLHLILYDVSCTREKFQSKWFPKIPSSYPKIPSSYPKIRPVDTSSKEKVDVLKSNNKNNITLLNNAEFDKSLDVDKLRIGQFEVLPMNTFIEMGSNDIDIDIHKKTSFNYPTMIDTDTNSFNIRGYAYIDKTAHVYTDLTIDDSKGLCFYNSNDINCLTRNDMDYMFMSSNYIDKSKILLSACISKDGLQNTKTNNSKNIPLDDEMVCIEKRDTLLVLDDWVRLSSDIENTYSVPVTEIPSNACKRDDIIISETYDINGVVYRTKTELDSALNSTCLTNPSTSCGRSTNYKKTLNINNTNTSDCDFNNVETTLGNLRYICPTTTNLCSTGCTGSNKKWFQGVCYTMFGVDGKNSLTDLLDNDIHIKVPGGFVKHQGDQSNILKVDSKGHPYRINYIDGKLKIHEDNDTNRRWQKNENNNIYHLKEGGSSGSNFKFYANGKFLLQIDNQWVCIENNTLVVKDEPNIVWEINKK